MGPRLTLVFGSIFYILYVAQISYPNNMLLYVSSGLLGFGGALLWVAQGNFLTLNSNSETMERNSGYFFAIFQSSQVWGNIFVFFQLQNVDDIDYETRLTVSSIANVIFMVYSLAKLHFFPAYNGSTCNLCDWQHHSNGT